METVIFELTRRFWRLLNFESNALKIAPPIKVRFCIDFRGDDHPGIACASGFRRFGDRGHRRSGATKPPYNFCREELWFA